MQHTVIAKSEQCLLDLSIQSSGSVTALFELAQMNGLSITEELSNGQELKRVAIADEFIEVHFGVNGILPASIDNQIDEQGGIEYDSIEFPNPYTQPY